MTKHGNTLDFDKVLVNVDEMVTYRNRVSLNLDEVLKDLDVLRADEEACLKSIHYL